MGITFLVWASVAHNDVEAFGRKLLEANNPILLLAALSGTSLLPDYVSLLETRYVIHLMRRRPSAGWTTILLIVDVTATAVTAALGLLLGVAVVRVLENDTSFSWHLFDGLIQATIYHLINAVHFHAWKPGFLNPGVWFYSAFFTSIWLWVYVLASVTLKSMRYLNVGIGAMRRMLDIDHKPITSVGMIALIMVTVGYWTLALIRWTGKL